VPTFADRGIDESKNGFDDFIFTIETVLKKVVGLERVPLSLVSTTEEILVINVAAPA
jgi:hypothetical protein